MGMNLQVSPSPHVRSRRSTSLVMLSVIIALLPSCVYGVLNFGTHALVILLVSVLSAVLSELLYELIMRKKVTIGDFSAVVTGLLVGMNMPPEIKWWIPVIGSAFAIIIVKQLFGGLGQNFMNPALAARCFLVLAFSAEMTLFTPGNGVLKQNLQLVNQTASVVETEADAVSAASEETEEKTDAASGATAETEAKKAEGTDAASGATAETEAKKAEGTDAASGATAETEAKKAERTDAASGATASTEKTDKTKAADAQPAATAETEAKKAETEAKKAEAADAASGATAETEAKKAEAADAASGATAETEAKKADAADTASGATAETEVDAVSSASENTDESAQQEVDAVSTATPLAYLKKGQTVDLKALFFGNTLGTIGETSALMILLGGIFLLVIGVIDWTIPVTYLGSFAILVLITAAAKGYANPGLFTLNELFAGGLMLGAWFMATDYVSSPMTRKGRIIFGLFLGVMTWLYRIFGGYKEGVSNAIILANCLTPLIDRFTRPTAFGIVKKKEVSS